MQVILTHEQADFDAIASLLGANLLQRDSLAILPVNLNRNVRAFLHLYGTELPFIHAEEIPKKSINAVTLVDTQSLITMKGMKKDTQIYVIDHHQKKPDFPSDWIFTHTETGACTTYFMEQFQESGSHLSLVQATLMLIGIYEDTGSLTYANTTIRDVLAVAYLLDHGASLKIAIDFLNPPLSLQQREIFERLIENINTTTINNCNIFISHASAPLLDDEVSSIAHKITDLYDPDALFIFVETREGIRLVARSVTDQINVAKISQHYKGGGHERAAAALIKRDKSIRNQLEGIIASFPEILAQYVKPEVIVRQIMSKRPLLINPETTAKEAHELMQKFGYEGYPVMEGNDIVGLLTRRAVDRALSHKLNLPASSLMDAGCVSVLADDSLDKLQYIMADSGWGQVPVLDPQTKQVTGIVTRTDLLKSIAGRDGSGLEKKNLADDLEENLPPACIGLLKIISMIAKDLQLPIYLVGGFARDLLLGSASLDLDFVVEGDAILLAQALARQYGGKTTFHKKFGTAKWHISAIRKILAEKSSPLSPIDYHCLPATIDLVSARTEFYERPTALPTVSRGSIKLDLHRRDFTINTMAIRLDGHHFGELYDYWGGFSDLKEKKVRVLHSLSFVDDPTRILRAVRFEQRFSFLIERRTLELLREARTLLKEVSGDRIRHEIELIFKEGKSPDILHRMAELNLFESIHPAIHWDSRMKDEFRNFYSRSIESEWRFSEKEKQELDLHGSYLLLLARLDPVYVKQICSRLRLKNHLRQNVLDANMLWNQIDQIKGLKPSEISRKWEAYSQIVIFCLDFLSQIEENRTLLESFGKKWRWIEPFTTGDTLLAIGLTPGPAFRKIIYDLKAGWIDGQITNQEEENRRLTELLGNHKIA